MLTDSKFHVNTIVKNGTDVYIGSSDGYLLQYRVSRSGPYGERDNDYHYLAKKFIHGGGIQCATVGAGNHYWTAGQNGQIAEDGYRKVYPGKHVQVQCLLYDGGTGQLWSGARGVLHIWEAPFSSASGDATMKDSAPGNVSRAKHEHISGGSYEESALDQGRFDGMDSESRQLLKMSLVSVEGERGHGRHADIVSMVLTEKNVWSAGSDGSIVVWDRKTKRKVSVLGDRDRGHVTCMELVQSNIFVGFTSGAIQIYNVQSLQLVSTHVVPRGRIASIQNKGDRLWVGCGLPACCHIYQLDFSGAIKTTNGGRSQTRSNTSESEQRGKAGSFEIDVDDNLNTVNGRRASLEAVASPDPSDHIIMNLDETLPGSPRQNRRQLKSTVTLATTRVEVAATQGSGSEYGGRRERDRTYDALFSLHSHLASAEGQSDPTAPGDTRSDAFSHASRNSPGGNLQSSQSVTLPITTRRGVQAPGYILQTHSPTSSISGRREPNICRPCRRKAKLVRSLERKVKKIVDELSKTRKERDANRALYVQLSQRLNASKRTITKLEAAMKEAERDSDVDKVVDRMVDRVFYKVTKNFASFGWGTLGFCIATSGFWYVQTHKLGDGPPAVQLYSIFEYLSKSWYHGLTFIDADSKQFLGSNLRDSKTRKLFQYSARTYGALAGLSNYFISMRQNNIFSQVGILSFTTCGIFVVGMVVGMLMKKHALQYQS
mmetsp:Transcript_14868/g.36365  ORF Transcript_14868/g.36365 Transcript_14868/m.36365 type:complete len:715 (+) Transcript_14868:579-2723(+)